MAKQIAGLCFLEGTFDDLTFYKMDGQYYVRVKSSLSSKRVKTSPEFKWTMIYARLFARASKIGSAIYKDLPPGWRQFWMYRSFTGEAFTLLKENPFSDEQVKQLLWKCYVEYWEQQKVADPGNPIWEAKPVKIRKRRKYSEESIMRKKDKYGKPYWRNPEEEEKKRLALEKKRAWCKEQQEKEAQQAIALLPQSMTNEQAIPITVSEAAIKHPVLLNEHATQNSRPEMLYPKQGTFSRWLVTRDGRLHSIKSPPETDQAVVLKEPDIINTILAMDASYSSA